MVMPTGRVYIKLFDSIMCKNVYINTEHIVSFHEADNDDKRLFSANAVLNVTGGYVKVEETVQDIVNILSE